jgi:hypothetical protein
MGGEKMQMKAEFPTCVSAKPIYWIIRTESGWLLRRFWRGQHETLMILDSEEKAKAELDAIQRDLS